MNNKEFVSELAQRTGYGNSKTQKYLLCVLNAMGDGFQEGNAVQVNNFGTFEVKKKLDRVMVNPNGQRLLVPPKLVLGFKPCPAWKDKIKNGGSE